MKAINEYINESSNYYEIYFSYKENKIKVHKSGGDDLQWEFDTIDDAVKTIYSEEDKNAQISIIPSDKFVKYMISLD